MLHLPDLIRDLGIILITASVVILFFKKLRQPVVLGYLVAGFLVGPHFDLFPTVRENHNIQIWAEIGVIFMLFALGLEFSFKKLFQVGKGAAVVATVEVLFMLGLGYLLGRAFGWNKMDSLFLGGILSISSTTIIVRAFEEMGLKSQSFVGLVFGVLIVEDLIAILLLVVLSSIAMTDGFSGQALMYSSLKLVFFMLLWFISGIYFLPTILNRVKNLLSDETVLVVAIGLCLMMVITASNVGFSPALGAFVMGSLLAETQEGHRIEQLIVPIKNLFSAIFFVSVGMLIDLHIVGQHFWIIFAVTVATVIGKFLSSTMGALLSGVSVKNSVQAGMSLAQIGEFSFIIATLGVSLKVTSEFLYPLAVVVSAITTLLTPYLIRYSESTAQLMEAKMPESVKMHLRQYQNAMTGPQQKGPVLLLWQEYGWKIIFNTVIVVALSLLANDFVAPFLRKMVEDQTGILHEALNWMIFVFSMGVCVPFIWAICFGPAAHNTEYDAETAARLKRLQVGVTVVRVMWAVVLVCVLVGQYFDILALSGVFLVILLCCFLFLFSRYSPHIYHLIERRFLDNLTERERLDLETKEKLPDLAPWDYHLHQVTVAQNAVLAGQSLEEIKFRERFHMSVVMIQRGKKRVIAPGKQDRLYPLDELFVIGQDSAVAFLKEHVEQEGVIEITEDSSEIALFSVDISGDHPSVHKTISASHVQEVVGGIIVGIERGSQRILNPPHTELILPADRLWVVGDVS